MATTPKRGVKSGPKTREAELKKAFELPWYAGLLFSSLTDVMAQVGDAPDEDLDIFVCNEPTQVAEHLIDLQNSALEWEE